MKHSFFSIFNCPYVATCLSVYGDKNRIQNSEDRIQNKKVHVIFIDGDEPSGTIPENFPFEKPPDRPAAGRPKSGLRFLQSSAFSLEHS